MDLQNQINSLLEPYDLGVEIPIRVITENQMLTERQAELKELRKTLFEINEVVCEEIAFIQLRKNTGNI